MKKEKLGSILGTVLGTRLGTPPAKTWSDGRWFCFRRNFSVEPTLLQLHPLGSAIIYHIESSFMSTLWKMVKLHLFEMTLDRNDFRATSLAVSQFNFNIQFCNYYSLKVFTILTFNTLNLSFYSFSVWQFWHLTV